MTIEAYFIQIGKVLEAIFPDHKVVLTISSNDGYVFAIYKGTTDEERYENPTYELILKDITEQVRANIDKRRNE